MLRLNFFCLICKHLAFYDLRHWNHLLDLIFVRNSTFAVRSCILIHFRCQLDTLDLFASFWRLQAFLRHRHYNTLGTAHQPGVAQGKVGIRLNMKLVVLAECERLADVARWQSAECHRGRGGLHGLLRGQRWTIQLCLKERLQIFLSLYKIVVLVILILHIV